MPTRLLVLCLALAAVLLVPGTAEAKTVWLCKPGLKGNPCTSSLTATVIGPGGKRTTERTRIPRDTPIDCFYVYPTVSSQPTPVANRKIDPELRASARAQASRFAQDCRVFAPVYRQITLTALLGGGKVTARMRAQAYADVRDAFREYLSRFSRGRGFVLLGHSQGTGMLRELIQGEIDRKPAVRRRLVSAILLGGNILVRKGRKVGGDFRNVPGCTSPRQTGCVIAYSAFSETPPSGALFGRPVANPDRFEVLCTNPAALGGGSARVTSYGPTAPFPGLLGPFVARVVELPAVSTPWVKYDGAAKARCARAAGASFLRVDPARADAPALSPQPDATWGLHLADINVTLGDLTELVARQARAYLAR